ncbi:MAG: hypothetical protein Q7S30_06280 [Candidatus Omnitrophota bacterium]|nr:hypothetical protein [Candidatus Omnitrophota bacterium]
MHDVEVGFNLIKRTGLLADELLKNGLISENVAKVLNEVKAPSPMANMFNQVKDYVGRYWNRTPLLIKFIAPIVGTIGIALIASTIAPVACAFTLGKVLTLTAMVLSQKLLSMTPKREGVSGKMFEGAGKPTTIIGVITAKLFSDSIAPMVKSALGLLIKSDKVLYFIGPVASFTIIMITVAISAKIIGSVLSKSESRQAQELFKRAEEVNIPELGADAAVKELTSNKKATVADVVRIANAHNTTAEEIFKHIGFGAESVTPEVAARMAELIGLIPTADEAIKEDLSLGALYAIATKHNGNINLMKAELAVMADFMVQKPEMKAGELVLDENNLPVMERVYNFDMSLQEVNAKIAEIENRYSGVTKSDVLLVLAEPVARALTASAQSRNGSKTYKADEVSAAMTELMGIAVIVSDKSVTLSTLINAIVGHDLNIALTKADIAIHVNFTKEESSVQDGEPVTHRVYDFDMSVPEAEKKMASVAGQYGITKDDILTARAESIARSMTELSKSRSAQKVYTTEDVRHAIDTLLALDSVRNDPKVTLAKVFNTLVASNLNLDLARAFFAKAEKLAAPEASLIIEPIERAMVEIGYSGAQAQALAGALVSMSENKGVEILGHVKQLRELNASPAEKAQLLSGIIRSFISYPDDVDADYDLWEVFKTAEANCQGFMQLFYVLGRASGLDVSGAEVKLENGKIHVVNLVHADDGKVFMVDLGLHKDSIIYISDPFRVSDEFTKIPNSDYLARNSGSKVVDKEYAVIRTMSAEEFTSQRVMKAAHRHAIAVGGYDRTNIIRAISENSLAISLVPSSHVSYSNLANDFMDLAATPEFSGKRALEILVDALIIAKRSPLPDSVTIEKITGRFNAQAESLGITGPALDKIMKRVDTNRLSKAALGLTLKGVEEFAALRINVGHAVESVMAMPGEASSGLLFTALTEMENMIAGKLAEPVRAAGVDGLSELIWQVRDRLIDTNRQIQSPELQAHIDKLGSYIAAIEKISPDIMGRVDNACSILRIQSDKEASRVVSFADVLELVKKSKNWMNMPVSEKINALSAIVKDGSVKMALAEMTSFHKDMEDLINRGVVKLDNLAGMEEGKAAELKNEALPVVVKIAESELNGLPPDSVELIGVGYHASAWKVNGSIIIKVVDKGKEAVVELADGLVKTHKLVENGLVASYLMGPVSGRLVIEQSGLISAADALANPEAYGLTREVVVGEVSGLIPRLFSEGVYMGLISGSSGNILNDIAIVNGKAMVRDFANLVEGTPAEGREALRGIIARDIGGLPVDLKIELEKHAGVVAAPKAVSKKPVTRESSSGGRNMLAAYSAYDYNAFRSAFGAVTFTAEQETALKGVFAELNAEKMNYRNDKTVYPDGVFPRTCETYSQKVARILIDAGIFDSVKVLRNHPITMRFDDGKYQYSDLGAVSTLFHAYVVASLNGKEYIIDITADQFNPVKGKLGEFADSGIVVVPMDRALMVAGEKERPRLGSVKYDDYMSLSMYVPGRSIREVPVTNVAEPQVRKSASGIEANIGKVLDGSIGSKLLPGEKSAVRKGLSKIVSSAASGVLGDTPVTVKIGSEEFVLTRADGTTVEAALRAKLSEQGVSPEKIDAMIATAKSQLDGDLSYEVAYAAVRNIVSGEVEIIRTSTRAAIELDENGNIINMSNTEPEDLSVYGEVLFRGHTHPHESADGEFSADIKNLNDGALGVDAMVILQGKFAVPKILQVENAATFRAIMEAKAISLSAMSAAQVAITPREVVYTFRRILGRFTEDIKFRAIAKESTIKAILDVSSKVGEEAARIRSQFRPPTMAGAVTTRMRVSTKLGSVPMDITATGSANALAQRIRDMQNSGIMTGALIAAPHIDLLIGKDGKPIANTGFQAIANLSKAESGVLQAAILVEGDEGAKRAAKFIEDIKGGDSIRIIDISAEKRNGMTIAGYISSQFTDVPYENIGIGLVNTEANVKLIQNEFEVNRANSASVVLVSKEVVSSCEAQTAYVPVVNVIYANTAKATSFLGLGIDANDTGVNTLVANIQKILGSSFIWRLIRNVAGELQNWFNSVNKVNVAV